MSQKNYRFSLERGSKKHSCPECKKKTFTKYIDNDGLIVFPEYLGKCDREQKCCYHYSPKDLYKDNPNFFKDRNIDYSVRKNYTPRFNIPKPKIVNHIPRSIMEQSLDKYEANNFVSYLNSLFSENFTAVLIKRFHLGTSKKYWQGANVFWQVDVKGNVRQAKVMLYNPVTGKRIKKDQKPEKRFPKIMFAGKSILRNLNVKDPNLKQCFFGEHQLSNNPNKIVALVESEKTAVLMSALNSDFIWLATGGKNGCKWSNLEIYNPLLEHKVIIFPDLGCFEDWKKKADVLSKVGAQIEVSDFLEKKATSNDIDEGFDLADYFIKRDAVFGWAITDSKYPLFWDFFKTIV